MRISGEQEGAMPTLHLADRLLSCPVDGLNVADRNPADAVALLSVARWAKDFLTKPHPALGRSGHVCPYVSAAIREQRFLLTVLRDAASQQQRVEQIMLRLGQHFAQLHPKGCRQAQLSTIVVLFPDLPKERAGDIINELHRRLKPFFLAHGMMLGEFFPDSSKPGLHNPDFRPLRSDVPLLVIRSMMLTDIAFLSDRARFVRAFIKNFGPRGCTEVRNYLEKARDTLSNARTTMILGQIARYEAGVRQSEQMHTKDHSLPLAAQSRAASSFGTS
ncbi:MAG TPA: hypothetical protein VGJ91_06280 [Polyangiaceae bacterium]